MESIVERRGQPPHPGEFAWQCSKCGHSPENLANKALPSGYLCPKCNCPQHRRIDTSWGIQDAAFDIIDPRAVRHFVTPLESCLNFVTSPKNERYYHPLKLKRFVSRRHRGHIETIIIENRCSVCDLLYSVDNIPSSRVDVLARALTAAEKKQLGLA